MSSYHIIQEKLKGFIKRYYSLQLMKGVILFLGLGALLFLLLLSVEYFLWLGSTGRLALLIGLILAECVLLYKYILVPLFYLFNLKKGLTEHKAAEIIGSHFPEINDKLYNLFDLSAHSEQSELLLASIEQRSKNFTGFDFSKAINFQPAWKQLQFLFGPALILGLLWFSGNISSFFGSYDRMINYHLAYQAPAPYTFKLVNEKLQVRQNEDFLLQVQIKGSIRPEFVYLGLEGQDYVMQETDGVFSYLIKSPKSSLKFRLFSSEVTSPDYELEVLAIPTIIDFNLELDYPNYLRRSSETLKSVGNAEVPEGTKVTWKISTQNTEKITLNTQDTLYTFKDTGKVFSLEKTLRNNMEYTISTSNRYIIDFENLSYSLKVIKDEHPSITVREVLDSLQPNIRYYQGNVSDDYGLKAITLVYFESNSRDSITKVPLKNSVGVVDAFYYTYPSGLTLKENIPYSFYFEVSDNDAVNGSKITKSSVFSASVLNANQLKDQQLIKQQSIISSFDKSVEKFKEQSRSLDKLNTDQKEKSSLSFNDQQKVNSFLEKQEFQEAQMQKFSKQLKDNLKNLNTDDKLNQLLQERLERQELQAEKNKKLLEELQKVADKIDKEDLARRLEDLAKKQKSGQRNLEQLLELTKQYYVTEKAAQLSKDLAKLAEKQAELAKMKTSELKEKEVTKSQSELNNEFKEFEKSLVELKKDNANLKKPLSIETDQQLQNEVKKDQESALDELKKEQEETPSSNQNGSQDTPNKASKKQKAASDKMKELSEKLAQSTSEGGSSSVAEDAEVLRQILDNLLVFTFKQENLMNGLRDSDGAFTNQAKTILKQQELKILFEHIDDSLFSLSLRVPEISEKINTEISEVFYNADKAMDAISENNSFQGISYQKYVLTAGNTLSDLLADILENMQQSMKSGKGEGQGEDFQLPDIIKAQGQLGEQMKKEGKGSPSSSGETGEQGEKGKQGENGSQGAQGKGGKEGASGEQGESGKQGAKGENGSSEQGNGGKNGNQGQGENGEGSNGGNGNQGISEQELKEIYEIYKQQEIIKQSLEKQLADMIQNSDRQLAQKLVQQMNDFQNNLLENGITRSTLEKANILQYELLKLEGAALKQGKKNERESDAAKNKFVNPITTRPESLLEFKNEEEILNRQALPLRQNFQSRIKDYFKKDD